MCGELDLFWDVCKLLLNLKKIKSFNNKNKT